MLSTNGTVNEASGCCPGLGVKRVILLEVDLKSTGLDTIWEISAKRENIQGLSVVYFSVF